jgi:hypothetical protein
MPSWLSALRRVAIIEGDDISGAFMLEEGLVQAGHLRRADKANA